MQITEIYADEVSETHLRNVAVNLAARDFAPPSAPIGASPETPMTTGVFLELPPGWDPQYHATPRRQLVVLLQGHLKITTHRRNFSRLPGGAMFSCSMTKAARATGR